MDGPGHSWSLVSIYMLTHGHHLALVTHQYTVSTPGHHLSWTRSPGHPHPALLGSTRAEEVDLNRIKSRNLSYIQYAES